jgi:predicted DNA-binding transcriptional regulator AlpA
MTLLRLLSARQLTRDVLRVSLMSLNRWLEAGQFPPPDLVINRVRYWSEASVQAWQQAHRPPP